MRFRTYEAELVVGVENDDALIICHCVNATLAVVVRHLQVREAALVIASPKELVKDTNKYFMLDKEVKRGAALRERSIEVGASEQQMINTCGTTLQRCNLEGSESIHRIVPIRVGTRTEQLAES